MKLFYDILQMNSKNHHVLGQQQIGKSHNLALFSLLLRMSNNYNVIYIHHPEGWLQYHSFLEPLVDQLKITLPHELTDKLHELEKLLLNKKKFFPTLKKLLESNNKSTILLVDQYNALSNINSGSFTRVEQLRDFIMSISGMAEKLIVVSSMTDDNYLERQSQNFKRYLLYSKMSDPVSEEYIQDLFGEELQSEKLSIHNTKEIIEIIKDITGRIPGQIRRVKESPREKIEDKILEYRTNVPTEVFNKIMTKLDNKVTASNYSRDDAYSFYAEMAISMNKNKVINTRLLPLKFLDFRYLRLDNGVAFPQFPAVALGLKQFIDIGIFQNFLLMAYQFGNNTLLGLAFEVALIEILGTTGDLKIELVHYDQKKKKTTRKKCNLYFRD